MNLSSAIYRKAKQLLETNAPEIADFIHAWRASRASLSAIRSTGLDKLERRFLDLHGTVVRSGPFAGMSYIDQATGSVLMPKLLGVYEQELHLWIEDLVRLSPPVIVDIGCAEGYYAVGLAKLIPGCRVYAFDTDGSARRMCEKLAQRNGVGDRVVVGGRCTHKELNRLLATGAALICDIEGGEDGLLSPTLVPALRGASIIVETHEMFVPGVTDKLKARFLETHDCQERFSTSRDSSSLAELKEFTPEERNLALTEFRTQTQSWLWLSPISQSD